MGGGAGGLEAAALVDGDVDQHRPGRMRATMARLTRRGAAAPGTSTAPITRSASITACSTASVVA